MTDSVDGIGWRQLREFAGVDLTRSFILSWELDAGRLAVDVDLYLEPSHPFYERPRPAEGACIRPAVIEFPCCDALRAEGDDGPAGELVGRLSGGAIRDLMVVEDGRYALSGRFGTGTIDADRPILRLKRV